jgi:hypothetical protein
MPSTYYQNKSARVALQAHSVKCVDFGEETGTVKSDSFKSVSSLDCIGDTEVLKTFCGTRANSSGGASHQSISFSFDPATLTCIFCKAPHKIFENGTWDSGASIIIFCDKNFFKVRNRDLEQRYQGTSWTQPHTARPQERTLDNFIEFENEGPNCGRNYCWL